MSQNKKIYVGQISFQCTEKDLETLFEQFGSISDIKIISDRETGRSRGFAFIEFDDTQSAEDSLKLHDSQFQGRKIVVNFARDKDDRRPPSSDRRRRQGG